MPPISVPYSAYDAEQVNKGAAEPIVELLK